MRCPSCGNENREGARFCDNCGTPLDAEPKPAQPAAQAARPDAAPVEIDGRYEIVDDLGRGGRKHVYLARDREARGREVAVALFETEGIAETAVTRARREAQAMERLGGHAHIVSVLATGEDAGRPYLVSEYMPGGDLAGVLAGRPSGRVEPERAIAIATDICLALEHAHARGIVHRDLKPANIWIGDDGSARLGDFGLAATERRSREAAEGLLVGTVAYLPPEQALGRSVDARADLYSLGAVVYEMVTGQPPFPGDDAVTIISRHVNAEPVPPRRLEPAVPPRLEQLILGLLAKSPDDRPESAAAVRVELARIAADPGAGADEPESSPLETLAGGAIVGRARELEQMRSAVEEALAGRGNLLFLVGEPGIGKTRAAEELATFARVAGARVLWGRCHEDERAPAFWPWIEAIREFVRDADPVGLRWELGPRAPDVVRLVPELGERLGEQPEPLASISEADRFRMFDSVAGFLADASRSRPLVIVLDDLHWADASSLELLRFASRQLSGTGLLLVGTYRDVELGRHHPLSGTLAELTATRHARRIALRGLDASGVAEMVATATGSEPSPALARAVWEQTEGNPFFVGEVVRLLASEGRLDGDSAALPAAIPEGVRDVVGQRLDRLTAEANDVLKVAAVAGREFEIEVVERASGRDPDDVERALATARENLLVSDESTAGAGWMSFAHAIVRETLYAELSTSQRVTLHKRVGEAIEAAWRDRLPDRLLDALAQHFIEAAPAGELDKAVDYARRAARRASGQLAHEDAANLYARALELVEGQSGADARTRMDIAYELGRSRWLAGRFAEARAAYEQVAELARELGDAQRLADAALGISLVAVAGRVDEPLVELLREALEAIDDPDGATGIQLRSAIAGRTIWRDPHEARRLADEALAAARRLGDDHALAVTLFSQQFMLAATPESPRDRLANGDELIQVARRSGDRDFEVRAHAYRLHAQLELGDIAAADAALADYTRLAHELRQPTHLWHVPMVGAMRATMEGRFEDAERLADEARRGGERAQEPLSGQFHALQIAVIRRLQGRLEEALPAVREMGRKFPAIRAWRLTLASFLAELGSLDEARSEFEQLAARDFDDVALDMQWVPAMTRLADTCHWLGDAGRAATLHRRLEPFAGLMVIVGRAGSCQGPVDHYLGLLALTMGHPEQAVAHFERAVELGTRVGDRPFVIEARYGLGRALAARGRAGDAERAAEELGACLDAAEAIGMRRMVERALAARLEAQGLADIDVLTSIEAVVAAVGSERPDLSAIASEDGTVTILFSDIENSTLLNERLGDARWLEVLREHNRVFRRRLAEHGGYEVKSQGDGFMLAFADPSEALSFAAEVQDELASGSEPAHGVSVRMGLHCGEAIAEEGDLFGRSVVLAARIAAQAVGGEILVSEALVERCLGTGYAFDEGRELELKGLSGTHRVYRAEPTAALAA